MEECFMRFQSFFKSFFDYLATGDLVNVNVIANLKQVT